MKALLKEPLLHFVVAAALIFAGYSWWSAKQARADSTIFISSADMERMGALYTAEAGSLPNAQDIQGMIADHVRNEALSREARKLGLDEGDTIIERRLAQKMTFMISDLAEDKTPEDQALQEWFVANQNTFEAPARISFKHIYLSQSNEARAAAMLQALNSSDANDWRKMGDAFMLQREYVDLPSRETIRLFGVDFRNTVFELQARNDWQGPISSALGTHLVKIERLEPASIPEFDTIRPRVEVQWQEENRKRQNAKSIGEIVSRYHVELEGMSSK